jgi:hypothetical protein
VGNAASVGATAVRRLTVVGIEVSMAGAVSVLVGEIRRQAVATNKIKTRIKMMGNFFTKALQVNDLILPERLVNGFVVIDLLLFDNK